MTAYKRAESTRRWCVQFSSTNTSRERFILQRSHLLDPTREAQWSQNCEITKPPSLDVHIDTGRVAWLRLRRLFGSSYWPNPHARLGPIVDMGNHVQGRPWTTPWDARLWLRMIEIRLDEHVQRVRTKRRTWPASSPSSSQVKIQFQRNPTQCQKEARWAKI